MSDSTKLQKDQNLNTKDSTNLDLYENISVFCILVYIFSYFMPATTINLVSSSKTILGWDAAFSATTSMGKNIGYFIGGLANFVLLFILIARLLLFYQKDNTPKIISAPLTHGLLVIVSFLSVSIWLIIWEDTLLIGYYVWAVSTIALSLLNFLSQRIKNTIRLNIQKDKEIIDHFIED